MIASILMVSQQTSKTSIQNYFALIYFTLFFALYSCIQYKIAKQITMRQI